jgi:hypothetical protein
MQDVTTQKDLIHALVIQDTVVMEFLATVCTAVNSPDITANTNQLQKMQLGTGHKVLTWGSGGYFWGVRKKPRTSEGGGGGGRKKQQNL